MITGPHRINGPWLQMHHAPLAAELGLVPNRWLDMFVLPVLAKGKKVEITDACIADAQLFREFVELIGLQLTKPSVSLTWFRFFLIRFNFPGKKSC